MKRILPLALFCSIGATSVIAGTMGPVESPNWSGPYVGVDGGYGWYDSTTNFTSTGDVYPPSAGVLAGLSFVPNATLEQNNNGPLAGVHLGYNQQLSLWILGLEGDYSWTGISDSSNSVVRDIVLSTSFPANSSVNAVSESQKIKSLANVRARLGHIFGQGQFYISGGAAWKRLNSDLLIETNSNPGFASVVTTGTFNSTELGYVAGVGYEWMITPSWIVRGEYLHYGFDNSSTDINVQCEALSPILDRPAVCGSHVNVKNDNINIVNLGISYKFDKTFI